MPTQIDSMGFFLASLDGWRLHDAFRERQGQNYVKGKFIGTMMSHALSLASPIPVSRNLTLPTFGALLVGTRRITQLRGTGDVTAGR